jgi:glycine/D-amino acid oxidase-like deaminating enzyme
VTSDGRGLVLWREMTSDGAAVAAGLHFPGDGAARADVIVAALKARALAAGARFIDEAAVTDLQVRGQRITGARARGRTWPADDVVIATGIWGPPRPVTDRLPGARD